MKKAFIRHTKLIKIVSVALFALLMAFNITVTMNSTGKANVDLSLSGIKAMAFGGGEDGGGHCHVYQPCPPGYTVGGVGCMGFEVCEVFGETAVICDGITTTC